MDPLLYYSSELRPVVALELLHKLWNGLMGKGGGRGAPFVAILAISLIFCIASITLK